VYKGKDAKHVTHLFIPLRHRVLWHIPHHTLPAVDLEPQRTFPTTLVRYLQHLIKGVPKRVGGVSSAVSGGAGVRRAG
jgi:hypothetical protein